MIAYRLHFEPGNLQAIEIAQDGTIGDLRIFNSVFSQQIPEGNVRLKRKAGGGPLMDMGVYQINAARSLLAMSRWKYLVRGLTAVIRVLKGTSNAFLIAY
jgi:predicted dehydrogenase